MTTGSNTNNQDRTGPALSNDSTHDTPVSPDRPTHSDTPRAKPSEPRPSIQSTTSRVPPSISPSGTERTPTGILSPFSLSISLQTSIKPQSPTSNHGRMPRKTRDLRATHLPAGPEHRQSACRNSSSQSGPQTAPRWASRPVSPHRPSENCRDRRNCHWRCLEP